jgi:hypothetical protein
MNEPVSMPHGLATHLLVVTGHVYRRRHREGNMKRLGLIVVTTAFALLAGCASSAPNAAASHHMVSCYEEDAATGTVWEITSPSPCGSLARLLIPDAKFQLLNYNPTMTVVCTSYYSSDGYTDRAGYTGTPDDATQTLVNAICGLFEHGGGSVTRNGSVPVSAAAPSPTPACTPWPWDSGLKQDAQYVQQDNFLEVNGAWNTPSPPVDVAQFSSTMAALKSWVNTEISWFNEASSGDQGPNPESQGQDDAVAAQMDSLAAAIGTDAGC